MRVLLVHDYGAPVGGAEVALVALRDDLRALGHDARVFASSAAVPDPGFRPDYECFGTVSRFRTLVQTANPNALVELRRVLREFRPDVVHVGMFLTQLSPLVLRVLRQVPAVYQAHWLRPLCPTGMKLRPDGEVCRSEPGAVCWKAGCLPARDWPLLMLQMKLWRRWAGAFDAVVANSRFLRDRLEEAGIAPVEVIYYRVALPPPRPPLGVSPVVGYAGRLSPEKGVDVLMRAFALVVARARDARLLLIGDGPERPRLERLAADLGIADRVDMAGAVPRAGVDRALAPAWVQAVPSLLEEPFGLAAAEAMARGTALVASDTGGLREIAGAHARLVPPGDAGALAAALIDAVTDREEAERLGKLGRESFRARFAPERYAADFVALYERLVERKSGDGNN